LQREFVVAGRDGGIDFVEEVFDKPDFSDADSALRVLLA
jgi:hypothetical protein